MLVERGVVQQHVDHRRHEQGKIDALARDGLEHRLGIETLQHMHGAAAHQRRQHLGAGDVADRRHREIARGIRDFEIGQRSVGPAAIFAMSAQHALGFSGGAAGVVQNREIVRRGKIARAGGAGGIDRGQQINPASGRTEREHGLQACGLGRQLPAAIAKRIGVDHQHLGFAILDLEQLVVERAQRMQPGDRQPRQLRRDAGAPAVCAIGGEERDARAGLKPGLHEHFLDAADQVGRRPDR